LYSAKAFSPYLWIGVEFNSSGRLIISSAPNGHTRGHIPHPTHAASSMFALLSINLIQSVQLSSTIITYYQTQ